MRSVPVHLVELLLVDVGRIAGAILLIAARRQDAISAAMAQHDYDTNVAAKVEIDRLIELCEHQAEMMGELHALVQILPVSR
jgi:uncharacterized membrane protein